MKQGSYQIQKQAQTQTQTLSPQQIMAVKLIELGGQEFDQRVRAEVLDNPALEEGPDMDEGDYIEDSRDELLQDLTLGDYKDEDDIPDYRLRQYNASRSMTADDIPYSDTVSFYDILSDQLYMRNLDEKDREIGEYIIGSLDNDGLLRKDLWSIATELSVYHDLEASDKDVERVLRVIQTFDPAGIGARDLKECLLLQLERRPESDVREMAREILLKSFDDFTKKNKEKIMEKLGLGEDDYTAAYDFIVSLNPRPGSSLGEVVGRNMAQIVPDFFVETDSDGNITMSLSGEQMPRLHISREFETLLDEHERKGGKLNKEQKDALLFMKQKADSARGFISAVEQRRRSLVLTMQAIIDIQRQFFLDGDETSLRPMILKDVADKTGLDISTISRVSNSKYVQTNYGIYSLKHFFVDGIVTDDGEELSTREIKHTMLEIIENEDKSAPLNDDALADALKEKGFPIARRTVAKYRHQLKIPVARLRRE